MHEVRLPLRAAKEITTTRPFVISGVLLVVILQIGGCYYMQAIRGQFEVMNARQPIPEVIADEEAPDELRNRLTIVQEARDFAIDELLLARGDHALLAVGLSVICRSRARLCRLERICGPGVLARAQNMVLPGCGLCRLSRLLR